MTRTPQETWHECKCKKNCHQGCNLITLVCTDGAQHGHWLGDCREKHPNYAGQAQSDSRTCKCTEREADKGRDWEGSRREADSWAVRRKFPQHLHPVASSSSVCVCASPCLLLSCHRYVSRWQNDTLTHEWGQAWQTNTRITHNG